jgi:DDE superfamily endonuclease
MHAIHQMIYNVTKRLRTVDEVEHYFPWFFSFIDCTKQQIPRPVDKRRRDAYYSGKKRRHIVKTQLMVRSQGFIVHKTGYKKGRRDMTVTSIKRIIL